jgi:predicted extracellular nuclease
MTSLVDQLPDKEQYTYVDEGNTQAIDHILASDALLETVMVTDAVHLDAEYPWVLTEPGGTVAERASDHDPIVAVFAIAA